MGGWKGAVTELGVSRFAFQEGAFQSYQEFCKDLVYGPQTCDEFGRLAFGVDLSESPSGQAVQ